jgi:dihydropteroate synthase
VELAFGERTWVMGIVNVTPDSFSGDGLALEGTTGEQVVTAAVEQGGSFVAAGAQLIDVGGESTRPRQFYGERRDVTADEERGAVVPVVATLAAQLGDRAIVSVDTWKGSVARAALAAGAGMVNDVWAGQRDPDIARAAAEHGAYLVLMHNQEVAEYDGDVVVEVIARLDEAVDAAVAAGVPRERLLVDPGIGFGKTGEHNLEILHRLAELKAELGLPLLIGTSRKRFIGRLLDDAPPEDRVEGTAATVALAIAAGADVVRVHDVAHIARTVRVADAIIRR